MRYSMMLFLLAATFVRSADNEVKVLENLTVRYHLTAKELEPMGVTRLVSFHVTPKKRLVLLTESKDGMRDLVIPEVMVSLLDAPKKGISGFCVLTDGTFTVVNDGYLCTLDKGQLKQVFALPSKEMQAAPAPVGTGCYLFGGGGETAKSVHQLLPARRYRKFIDLEEPIVAAGDAGDAFYAATALALYEVKASGTSGKVCDIPKAFGTIRGIAAAPSAGMIFISNDDGLFLHYQGRLFGLVAGAGGAIILREDSLFMMDAKRSIILEIPDLVKTLTVRGETK